MKKIALFLPCLLMSLIGCGNQPNNITPKPDGPDTFNYYDGYYDNLLSWENGTDLKAQLHNIISGGTYSPINYNKPNFESNIDADHTLKNYEFLDVLYSSVDVDSTNTNDGWQREHCFPASLMTGSNTTPSTSCLGRATDFHNLWAANSSANSSRGNKNYGVANTSSMYYQNRTTNNGNDGYSFDEKTFEPGNKDKGIVARSIFYMATMYSGDDYDSQNGITMKGLSIVEDQVNFIAGNDCKFSIGGLSTLLDWNKYPVSDLEQQHNESVYTFVPSMCDHAQGNRNPYVDYPELVDYVFGDKQDEAGSLANLTPSLKTLARNQEGLYHHRIQKAKRSYKIGESFLFSDVQVLDVNYDYTTNVTSEFECSIDDGYVFTPNDGTKKEITLTFGFEKIKYTVDILASGATNTISTIIKSGLSNKVVGQDQIVTFDDVSWKINFNAPSGFTMTNDNKRGGVKFGSGTYSVNSIKITSTSSYKVNAVYIEAFLANTSSSYFLKIKVGDIQIKSCNIELNNSSYKEYGATLASPLEGIISFEFTGSTAINLKSMMFNIVD